MPLCREVSSSSLRHETTSLATAKAVSLLVHLSIPYLFECLFTLEIFIYKQSQTLLDRVRDTLDVSRAAKAWCAKALHRYWQGLASCSSFWPAALHSQTKLVPTQLSSNSHLATRRSAPRSGFLSHRCRRIDISCQGLHQSREENSEEKETHSQCQLVNPESFRKPFRHLGRTLLALSETIFVFPAAPRLWQVSAVKMRPRHHALISTPDDPWCNEELPDTTGQERTQHCEASAAPMNRRSESAQVVLKCVDSVDHQKPCEKS